MVERNTKIIVLKQKKLPICWSLGRPLTLVKGSCRRRIVLGFEKVKVMGFTLIADETGGKAGKNYRGPGTENIAYITLISL